MASVRCTDVQARPTEFLDVTSVVCQQRLETACKRPG